MTSSLATWLITFAVAQLLGTIVAAAVGRAKHGSLVRRVRMLERAGRTLRKHLPEQYMPREVIEGKLQRITDLVTTTNSLVRASASSPGLSIRAIEASEEPISLSEAIARQEGFGKFDTRATRNNNPGNLEYRSWMAKEYAATLEVTKANETPRFARFLNAQLGHAALLHVLQSEYQGCTVRQMLSRFAPASENDLEGYIHNVCTWTGLAPDTEIDSYL